MAFTPHMLVQLSGTLQGGEIWSSGIRLRTEGGGAPPASDNLEDHLTEMTGLIQDDWVASGSGISQTARLTTVKLNAIGADGHYRDPITHVRDIPPLAGNYAPTVPSFNTWAGTLRTAVKRGRASHGRMYLPNFGLAMASYDPPFISADTAHNYAVWLEHLITDICTSFPGGTVTGTTWAHPIVASKLDGTIRDVTRIDVGNVCDFISRRKDAIRETYSGVDYTE